MEYSLMTTSPQAFKEGELTAMYVKILEEKIKLEPANYLWSHRRFKYEYDASKHAALLVS
jgi:KDO2-lipid IV(A) lauroyltransferase